MPNAHSRGINAGVDAVLFAQPERFGQKFRLKQRLAAGEGHTAARTAEVALEAEQFFDKLFRGDLRALVHPPGVRVVTI